MAKLAWTIGLGLALLVGLPTILTLCWLFWVHFIQSPYYAARYFGDLFTIENVLESRRWHWGSHPWADNALGCTFAIATLPDNSLLEPPSAWDHAWTNTLVIKPSGQHDVVSACSYLWSDAVVSRLENARDNPGSFFTISRETLLLYSPTENIVAAIRFGD